MIPQVFLNKYNLKGKAHNGYTFAWVNKGMYGLPQSERIAHDSLVKHMDTYGYLLSSKKTAPYKHNSRTRNFTLVNRLLWG